MKILLVSNYAADRQQSMLRYAAFLRAGMSGRGHRVRVIAPKVLLGGLLPAQHKWNKWLGYLDKYVIFRITLPWQLCDAEVVHVCDHSNSPYLAGLGRRAKVITCHDGLAIRSALGHFASNRTRGTGRVLQRWILKSLERATLLIHVSEKTRQDFESLMGRWPASEVIPHALNWPYRRVMPAGERWGLAGREYLLHVGGNQWYKNRLGVLEIFRELKQGERFEHVALAMVGPRFTAEMRRCCDERRVADVLELTGVGNEELQALYSGALALLFPSLEEGFGWPILEAQACGCPVITTGRPPMTEIAGEAAIYIDPGDARGAAQAIMAGLERAEGLREAGWANVARFEREQVLDRYELAYARAMAHKPAE